MMMRRSLLSCTKGAAAAEMALILPLSLLLLFTALEAGHYMYQRHQVVKGLRDGARYAARQSFDLINCRNGTGFIDSDVEATVIQLARTGQIANGSPRVSNWPATAPGITVSVTCPTAAEAETGLYDSGEPAPQVNISTDFSYDSLFSGLGVLDDTIHIVADQQATVMGL